MNIVYIIGNYRGFLLKRLSHFFTVADNESNELNAEDKKKISDVNDINDKP